ncbi:DNA replication and repair protein RecF [soil metagenome]
MRVRALRQIHLRNLVTERLAFEDGVTAVVGPNGAGKSNLLAALALGAGGALPSGTIGEALRFGTDEGYVRVDLETNDGVRSVEVALSPGRKTIRLDGQVVRLAELARIGGVVRIGPEDADLVHGPPARRRGFLDDLLGRTSLRYALVVRAYHRVVEQRNALLKSGGALASLAAWDDRFLELGREVEGLRARAIASLAPRARDAYDAVAGDPSAFDVALGRSHSEHDLADALAASRSEERARGVTVVGPHRDDLVLTLAGRAVQAYGSRGEARTAALALRVAEFELLDARHGAPPLLLLDDVHAELDARRRAFLADLAARTPQAIVTGTEPPARFDHHLHVDAGLVRPAACERVTRTVREDAAMALDEGPASDVA